VYLTPRVERFGTFRELTRIGLTGASDGVTVCGPNGGTGSNCTGFDSSGFTGCSSGETSGGHS